MTQRVLNAVCHCTARPERLLRQAELAAQSSHEFSHGGDITWTLRAKQAPEHIREAWIGTSWIVELNASGTRDGKSVRTTHLYCFTRRTSRCDTSLRTAPEALLQLVRDHRSNRFAEAKG